MSLDTGETEFKLDLELSYNLGAPVAVADEAVVDFVERSALFTAVPFFRATVLDLCSRMSISSIYLPLIKPASIIPRQAT
jgi:hypothetical protein